MKNAAFCCSHLRLLSIVFLLVSSFGLAQQKVQPASRGDQSALVHTVREATRQYLDINNATADGYGQFLGCVSGSDHGAMGVHYVNPNLLNGTIDVKHPQALIYEPVNGRMKLVGVEFIVDQATWLKNNNNVPPVSRAKRSCSSMLRTATACRLRSSSSTYGRGGDNPQGDFVDWNDHVSCSHE